MGRSFGIVEKDIAELRCSAQSELQWGEIEVAAGLADSSSGDGGLGL